MAAETMNIYVYDFILWLLSIPIDLFFREVHPRSSWKIPRSGPVLFVGAPHANQFVDPLILMRTIRIEAKRRASLLIAAKSMERKFVGFSAGLMGSVAVGRALDSTKSMPGRVYLPDPDDDPTLLRGQGTRFNNEQFQVGGLIVMPSINNVAANAEIVEIIGPEEIRLKKPFKGKIAIQQLTGRKEVSEDEEGLGGNVVSQINRSRNEQGTLFKVAPKVDQSKVYNAVFNKLTNGGCVGIFPEGGSHDRTDLLPLKAGVAIMALGAVAADPNCNLKIVPCGMNYFHAHKFRSRAVIEFGTPIEVPPELVEEYKNGSRRDAIGKMLEIIYNSLVAVTVTSPDYDTLMLIQAVRRLYNPKGKKLPLPIVVEMNRRLVKGYTRYQHDPRIVNLKKNVMKYHKSLMALNIRDHQIAYAKLSIIQVVAALLYRIGKLAILSTAVLPGLVLFAPIFIAGKLISIKKSREALAASTVKIQARDVLATWKLLVSLALAPTLYTYYIILFTTWTWYNRIGGRVPESVPLWAMVAFGCIFFPAITFAALRFGEIGMDIAKSLRPLALCLNPSSGNTLVKLRKQREELVAEVTNLINELGPEMFPDFDVQRLVSPSGENGRVTPRESSWSDMFQIKTRDHSPSADHTTSASIGGGSSSSGHMPRNESFKNIAKFGFFASRPQTPTRGHSRTASRSRPGSSGGFLGGFGFTTKGSGLDAEGALDDVSQKIRGAMRERGQRRASLGKDDGDDSDASSGMSTPETNGLILKKKK